MELIIAIVLLCGLLFLTVKASEKKRKDEKKESLKSVLASFFHAEPDGNGTDTEEQQTSGLSDQRLRHSLGVARRCYEIAKDKGLDEDGCKKLFVLGYVHDIGYEFADNRSHAGTGAEMLDTVSFPLSEEVLLHGKPLPLKRQSEELQILNRADIETMPDGTRCSAQERLKDTAARFGEDSTQYKDQHDLASTLGLLD